MKILFTKKINIPNISEKLGSNFSIAYKECITAENHIIQPFDIKGKILIFTSVNGVGAFGENNFKLHQNKIFVVGNKTKKALCEKGVKVEQTFNYASELAHFIQKELTKCDCIHFCGNLSLDILPNNENYKKIEVYKTQLLCPKIEEKYDAVVFFSPSGVRSFATYNSFNDIQSIAIGTTTETELKLHTQSIITSPEPNLNSILNEILKFKND